MSSLFWFALPVFAGIIMKEINDDFQTWRIRSPYVILHQMLAQCVENPLLAPNEAEREICEENAGTNRKLITAIKDRRLSCNVCCKYDDGTEEVYHSPNGQKCCDIVGGLPTGCCKDGKCPVGLQNCPKE